MVLLRQRHVLTKMVGQKGDAACSERGRDIASRCRIAHPIMCRSRSIVTHVWPPCRAIRRHAPALVMRYDCLCARRTHPPFRACTCFIGCSPSKHQPLSNILPSQCHPLLTKQHTHTAPHPRYRLTCRPSKLPAHLHHHHHPPP